MKNEKEVGITIRKLRGDMSLRDFAKKCDISHTTIDNLEKGIDFRTGKPVQAKITTLQKIADACGVPLTYIVGEDEQPTLDEELKIALFGVGTKVTDEMWNMVVNYAKFVKAQNEQKIERRKHNMSISINLKLAMFKEGLNIQKLAQETQISNREIDKYLNAQKIPGTEEAKKIAKRLNISLKWFMCIDETISYWEGLCLEGESNNKQIKVIDFAQSIGIDIEPVRTAISDEELFEPLPEYRRIARSENYDDTEDAPPSQEHLENIVKAAKNDTKPAQ